MIQKPVTLADSADEADDSNAAKRRLNPGDRNTLNSIAKQAKHLRRDDRKVKVS